VAKSLNPSKNPHLIQYPIESTVLSAAQSTARSSDDRILAKLQRSLLLSALSITTLTSASLILLTDQAFAAESSTANSTPTSKPPLTVAEPLDRVVATVDDSVILASDVNQAFANAKKQFALRQQTPPSDDVLLPDVVRQLILRNIQIGILARNNASVDDSTLDEAISNIAKQQGLPSLDALKKTLDDMKPNGYSIFRKQVLDDLNINQLQQQRVSSRIKISEKDVDNFLNSPQSADALKDQFNFNLIQVAIAGPKQPQDVEKAMTAAYEILLQLRAGKSLKSLIKLYPVKVAGQGWRKSNELPTPFVDALSALKPAEFSQPFQTVDSVDILQLLETRGAKRAIVHQYSVRHILVKTNEIMSVSDGKIKIDDIYAKIKSGASFADMAKSYSDDPGSAQNGGSLNWVAKGEMVPSFEETMINTPVGQMSEPFQSPYGWHILQVQAERDADMTEQYRRNTAKQALYERQFPVELDNWLREIRATAYVKMFN
jgi:peptidyl-prolyl cis-trans isomerase SurA